MDFQNEYSGGDDFCSKFSDEILELQDRTAFHTHAPTHQSAREIAVA
jgi:hypothetical protein